jgi:hypothetical protein
LNEQEIETQDPEIEEVQGPGNDMQERRGKMQRQRRENQCRIGRSGKKTKK